MIWIFTLDFDDNSVTNFIRLFTNEFTKKTVNGGISKISFCRFECFKRTSFFIWNFQSLLSFSNVVYKFLSKTCFFSNVILLPYILIWSLVICWKVLISCYLFNSHVTQNKTGFYTFAVLCFDSKGILLFLLNSNTDSVFRLKTLFMA